MAVDCTRAVIKTEIEYREVKIPVRCNVAVPERPVYGGGNPALGVLEVFEYCETLETLLKTCTGGE